MDERELLELLKTDPERGLDAAIRAYGALVLAAARTALAGVGNGADAEECAADAFAGFFRSLASFDPSKGTVKAYLCSAARNRAADLRRQRRREKGNVSLDGGFDTAGGASPEAEAERAETRRELIGAIDSLSEPDREIVVRRYYLGEPTKSVAKRLGLCAAAVDTRAHRALKKLKALLTDRRSL